jgi:hypothetical protein
MKDPFRLPVSMDRVQKMLITLGEMDGSWANKAQEERDCLLCKAAFDCSETAAADSADAGFCWVQ